MSWPILYILSPEISARLKYVTDWLFAERLGVTPCLVTDASEIPENAIQITYGSKNKTGLTIPSAGLLFDAGIRLQDPATGYWDGTPVLFHIAAADTSLPFDLFSAVFFLITRYEEYLPFTPDRHNRYPADESILARMGALRLPLVDIWIDKLSVLMAEKLGVVCTAGNYNFLPTYDIDIAYSYLHKGWWRNTTGFVRDLLRGDLKTVKQRMSVQSGRLQDPYDSFDRMQKIHAELGMKPLFFLLCCLQTTDYDKNISPRTPAMKQLIAQLSKSAELGIHPSYYSAKSGTAQKEKKTLESIAGRTVQKSRQHYIRLAMPETLHRLIKLGITNEYSMGYPTRLGFRAGTGASFPWFNPIEDKTHPIRLHPFCFMDTTARFEEGMSADQAFTALAEMEKELRNTNSTLITIFHNFSLGSDPGWSGWQERYQSFLRTQIS